jgi:hypothetical protein
VDIKHELKVLKNRFITVRKDIQYPAIVAISSIIIGDIFLKHTPAFSQLQYDVGQLFIKLCYSFTSAFIFFFIVVHMPKERRKVRVYRFVNNKTLAIDREVRNMMEQLSNSSGINLLSKLKRLELKESDINQAELEEACRRINPNTALISQGGLGRHFSSWFDYLDFTGDNIKTYIQELLALNDSIDNDLLEHLTHLYDDTSILFEFKGVTPGNIDLDFMAHSIRNIIKDNALSVDTMAAKYRRYQYEYHYNYRKKQVK